MPTNNSDYVSEQAPVHIHEPYQTPEKLNKPTFSAGLVKKPNFGKQIPDSALASDSAGFTGPREPTFTKNANKFSEDSGNNFNGPFTKSYEK